MSRSDGNSILLPKAVMIALTCPHCFREVHYTTDPPPFCGYCREPLPAQPGSSLPGIPPSTLQFDPADASARSRPLDSIGDYQLGVKLGAGGMGTVYEAVHEPTGRRVAIKVLAQRLSGDPQQMERFRQEGRLASQINHPRCVFVYAADEDRGRPYIVMELMAGTTLEDQLKGQGKPLPVREAIDRTLEVIDGLTAAHRLGVLHRDVKPSNCFLLEDGTVKVGDFGLSKVLAHDAEFSEPGAYKGTVTFSPPEQLRNEALDLRADVYSVTATLYYLLTGRAPFEGESWVTAVARAASEPPPDVRRDRPEIPPALAAIIRRGLHPDRNQRYGHLDELRQALVSQMPTRMNTAGFGLRVGAWLIDEAVLSFRFLIPWQAILPGAFFVADGSRYAAWMAVSVIYFAIFEGIGGASLGKRSLRLRVLRAEGLEAPGVRRALLRAMLVALAFAVPRLAVAALPPTAPRGLIQALGTAAGLLILAWPMRLRNGFRGWHEHVSRTRTVQLPWPDPPLTYPARHESVATPLPADGLPPTLGPFQIRGLFGERGGCTFIDALELTLERRVLILLHAPHQAPDPRRRELARPARLRWLTGGIWGQRAWEAFLAPGGRPMTELVEPHDPMPWIKARPLLEQLNRELIEAAADSSMPSLLSLEQIYIQEDGRLQLLDSPLPGQEPARSLTPLELLQHTAILLLEGRPPRDGELPRPVRAPVPGHAIPLLERLIGLREQQPSLNDFAAQLDASRDRPRAVNLTQKIAYLSVLAVLHAAGLLLMFAPTFMLESVAQQDQTNVTRFVQYVAALQQLGAQQRLFAIFSTPVVFFPLLWAMWSFCFRGGITHDLAGLRLVRQDGRMPTRWQCALRSLLVWTPLMLLLLLANLIRLQEGGRNDLADTVMWSAVGLLGVYAYFSLLYPSRSVHDWLAGTWLVPQ